MASENKKIKLEEVPDEVKNEIKNEVKADPIITLKESELNQRLQTAYNRGRVTMLADIKSDITKYFDDTLLSYVPH